MDPEQQGKQWDEERKLQHEVRERLVGSRDLIQRRDFYYGASRFTPLLGVDTDAGSFVVSSTDFNIGRTLFAKKDRGEFRALTRGMALLDRFGLGERARAGTFIDVGANIGTTTVAALRAADFRRAVCLEPEPRNQRLLRVNIELNDLSERVQVIGSGASDTLGKARLLVSEDKSGIHEVAEPGSENEEWAEGRRPMEIDLVTLDSLVENSVIDADGTGMLWSDAEGHEGRVVAGAGRLLSTGTPAILEIAPEKLERQGVTDLLVDAMTEHYTHFIHMRKVRLRAIKKFPVSQLREMVVDTHSHVEALFLRL
jgi:FkbM family methyltransferase